MKVKDAVIGKNIPPFHDGCRCGISFFDPERGKRNDYGMKTRWARDPATGQGTYVPVNWSYLDWYQSLSNEQKEKIPADVREAVEEQIQTGKDIQI